MGHALKGAPNLREVASEARGQLERTQGNKGKQRTIGKEGAIFSWLMQSAGIETVRNSVWVQFRTVVVDDNAKK